MATPVKEIRPLGAQGQDRVITLFVDESTSLDATGVKRIIVTNSQVVHVDRKFVILGKMQDPTAPAYFVVTALQPGVSEIVKIMENGEKEVSKIKVLKTLTLDNINTGEINAQFKRLFPKSDVTVRAEVINIGGNEGDREETAGIEGMSFMDEKSSYGKAEPAGEQRGNKAPRAAASSGGRGKEEVALFLEGSVASNYDLDGMLNYLRGITKNVVNLSRPDKYKQVKLEAKIVELNRTKLRDMGVNILGVGSSAAVGVFTRGSLTSFDFNIAGHNPILNSVESTVPIQKAFNILAGAGDFRGILSILEDNNMAKTLSNPSLIVEDGGLLYDRDKKGGLDGKDSLGVKKAYDDEDARKRTGEPRSWVDKSAELFVGGEIPVPVPQSGSNNFTIEWKKFGITLNFLPRVMADGRIKLKVWAESGDLNDTNAVTINAVRIPSIDTRYVETEVTLAENESFAIGGLLYSRDIKQVSKIPLLGDIPVIGTFFKNTQSASDERELVVIIKPSFVTPGTENIKLVDESRDEFKWSDYILGKF
jgi:Flp pilus assembly secretin CpaC